MLHSILTSHQYPEIVMFMICFDVSDYTARVNDKRFVTLQDRSKGHFLFRLHLVTQCHADSLDAFTCAQSACNLDLKRLSKKLRAQK